MLRTFIGKHVANIGVDTTRDIVRDADGFGDIKVRRRVVVSLDVVVRGIHRMFVFVEGRHSVSIGIGDVGRVNKESRCRGEERENFVKGEVEWCEIGCWLKHARKGMLQKGGEVMGKGWFLYDCSFRRRRKEGVVVNAHCAVLLVSFALMRLAG